MKEYKKLKSRFYTGNRYKNTLYLFRVQNQKRPYCPIWRERKKHKMKKREQIELNNDIVAIYEQFQHETPSNLIRIERLRSCQANVIYTGYGFWLRSYNTIVAFIPYYGGVCYDFLRYVYEYTATSAQHIAKFAKDYGNGEILRYKDV